MKILLTLPNTEHINIMQSFFASPQFVFYNHKSNYSNLSVAFSWIWKLKYLSRTILQCFLFPFGFSSLILKKKNCDKHKFVGTNIKIQSSYYLIHSLPTFTFVFYSFLQYHTSLIPHNYHWAFRVSIGEHRHEITFLLIDLHF